MRKAGKRMATTTAITEVNPVQTHTPTASSAASSARSVPSHNWRAHWLTVNEFARMMGRRPFTVHWWLRNGTLAEFGIPVCRFRCGGLHSGRIFIQNIY
jgi:hypothetical protein